MFQGFSDAAVDFMWGIRLHNERPWFEDHKDEYLQYLYHPMKDLAHEVYTRFQAEHDIPGLCVKVSRIYRDARRLHGRGPYKDHLWFSMDCPGDAPSRPSFWFELRPEGWGYGLGYYSATPLTMAKFRARLDGQPAAFRPLAKALSQQDTFLLTGESYARSKGETTPLLAPWYQKRRISLECSRPLEPLICSRGLTDRLLEGYRFLLPFFLYFNTLERDPDPRQP